MVWIQWQKAEKQNSLTLKQCVQIIGYIPGALCQLRHLKTGIVFTATAQGVTSVTVSPSTATVSKGQNLELSAVVVTTGFANKAVYWSVDEDAYADGVRISDAGKLIVPADATVTRITVTATSIYDNTKTGTATITVA